MKLSPWKGPLLAISGMKLLLDSITAQFARLDFSLLL